MSRAHDMAHGHERLRALIEFALDDGWEVVRTALGNLEFSKPGLPLIYTSSTVGEHRAACSARAQRLRGTCQDSSIEPDTLIPGAGHG